MTGAGTWSLSESDYQRISEHLSALLRESNARCALLVDRTTPRDLRMQTGLGNLDLIVAIDGKREPMTVGALTAYVFREKHKGSKLKVTTMQITDRFPRPEHEVEVTVK